MAAPRRVRLRWYFALAMRIAPDLVTQTMPRAWSRSTHRDPLFLE